MSEMAPLKYLCYDKNQRKHIISICDNEEIKKHILDLYNLIEYQLIMIHEQRSEIIAKEHKKAWKHYDKKDSDETRT
jgi:hypothetical protein